MVRSSLLAIRLGRQLRTGGEQRPHALLVAADGPSDLSEQALVPRAGDRGGAGRVAGRDRIGMMG
jgi:hypothetical protein